MRHDVPIALLGDHAAIEAAACSPARFVYLTKDDGVLAGWIDCRLLDEGTPLADAETQVEWRETGVAPETSLKEALARMLALGYRTVPVVDGAGHLLGDVSLADVERTMEGGDAHLAANAEEASA
jgi:Mg/Co/Ni transporter MgtE